MLNVPRALRRHLSRERPLPYFSFLAEPGEITLKAYSDLVLENAWVCAPPDAEHEHPHKGTDGYYVVPIVSLCARSSQWEEPAGILIWVPTAEAFGQWDFDHGTLFTFPKVPWWRIKLTPRRYLCSMWGDFLPTARAVGFRPWERGMEFREGPIAPDILGYEQPT